MDVIGQYLKQLRKEQNVSLNDVAKRVGVTTSFLSQVENGKATPSLSTLKNIADVLHTTISNMMGENVPTEHGPVLRKGEGRHLPDMNDGVEIELLTNPDPYKQMEPLYFTLKKDASAGEETYQHYGQEFLLVLRGTIEVMLNSTRYVLKKGDSMYFNSKTPHSFKNGAQSDTEVVWVVTPPSF